MLDAVKYSLLEPKKKVDALKADIWRLNPFFGRFLIQKLKVIDDKHYLADFKTAFTDGKIIGVHEDLLAKLEPDEMTFIIYHELLHIILGHCVKDDTVNKVNHQLRNVVQDIIINSYLCYNITSYIPPASWDKTGGKGIKPYKNGIIPPADFSTSSFSELWEQVESQLNGAKLKAGDIVNLVLVNKQGIRMEIELNITQNGYASGLGDGNATGNEQSESALSKELGEAHADAKMNGLSSQGIEDIIAGRFEKIVDWRKILKAQFRQWTTSFTACFSNPKKTFVGHGIKMPDYVKDWQDIYNGVDIFKDTSGSIGEKELSLIVGEIQHLIKEYKMEGTFYCWDTELYEGTSLKDINTSGGVTMKGRGGTDIKCVTDFLNENFKTKGRKKCNHRAVVVVTDGYFSDNYNFPKELDIIWLIWDNEDFKPYGPGKHVVVSISSKNVN